VWITNCRDRHGRVFVITWAVITGLAAQFGFWASLESWHWLVGAVLPHRSGDAGADFRQVKIRDPRCPTVMRQSAFKTPWARSSTFGYGGGDGTGEFSFGRLFVRLLKQAAIELFAGGPVLGYLAGC